MPSDVAAWQLIAESSIKKRFFGQDVCFFHHLLINVFFRFGLVHFKRQKNIFKKSHLHGIPDNRTFAHRHNPNVSGWYY